MNVQYGFIGIIVLLSIIVLRTLLVRDRDPRSGIRMEDLLLGEDGKLSKSAAVMMGSFLVSNLIMVYLTFTNRLTEGYMGLYLTAWVAPTVTALIVRGGVQKAQAQPDAAAVPADPFPPIPKDGKSQDDGS